MWFAVPEQPVFAIAGFRQAIGEVKYFAMVTRESSQLVAPVHPKAMVTILVPEDHERWLTGSYEEATALQRPFPVERMVVRGPAFPTREIAM